MYCYFRWVTVNDELACEDPCFFCATCFKGLHYTPTGEKICDFQAYLVVGDYDWWFGLSPDFCADSPPWSVGSWEASRVVLITQTNLVPRVHWLFGQREGASRDSGIMEKIYFFDWLIIKQRERRKLHWTGNLRKNIIFLIGWLSSL